MAERILPSPQDAAADGLAPANPFRRIFLDHPRSVGESYREHAGIALRFGGAMVAAGAKCMVHALVPSLFRTSASDCVHRLKGELERRRASADHGDYVI